MNRVHHLFALSLAVALPLVPAASHAAPLPNGTLLTIRAGAAGYPEGNCGGSYLRFTNDLLNCYPITPGRDGGLIVGKPQRSGGQESAAWRTQSTGGDLTGVIVRPDHATLATAPMAGASGGEATEDARANRFDDASCSGAGCRGKVEINALHQAYRGQVLPGGCAVADCSATGGTGVRHWVVNPDRSYRLDAGWGAMQVHLEGQIILPGNRPPLAEPVLIVTRAGETVRWLPLVSDPEGDKLSCRLLPNRQAFYGALTLEPDCSVGVYVPPNAQLIGTQCRHYQVSDGRNASEPASICVKILPRNADQREIFTKKYRL